MKMKEVENILHATGWLRMMVYLRDGRCGYYQYHCLDKNYTLCVGIANLDAVPQIYNERVYPAQITGIRKIN